MLDLVIIGAGPAGITGAIYAARKNMDFILVSKNLGGQAALSSEVENYTGYQFIAGPDLVAKFEEHLRQFSIRFHADEEVLKVTPEGKAFRVESGKGSYETRSLLVASGRRQRRLNVPGEDEYRNKGVSYCATCDGPVFRGKRVAVIGGGNAALDACLQMLPIAASIDVITIHPALGGDEVLRRKIQGSSKVRFFFNTRVREILGETFVTGLTVEREARPETLRVEGVFIEIGSVPNAEIVDFAGRNASGEIIIDHLNQTNIPGLFAAGDVTNVPEKQIIIAAGEGAKAVLGIFHYLSRDEARS